MKKMKSEGLNILGKTSSLGGFLSRFFLSSLFFENAVIKTFMSWEGDFRLLVTDDENVSASGGESFSVGIS